ncbi:MAG: DUF3883 domain-containing protein [Oscillospiraceae bacterium]|nr:DUF3883 domain-containing protein [Oscillospiraceae bacterium]
MYNHYNQYRCSIIRGKSQKATDNLLPLYAKIIVDICPCDADSFTLAFDNAFNAGLTKAVSQKTLDNHRTEIAGTLFGMFYAADDGCIYASERTLKFIEDSDTPAFFKDICYKMQFPNGQSTRDLKIHIDNKLNIRQYPFILKVMLLAKNGNLKLTKKDIGYYMLNSLDVLQGIANPLEVYDTIVADKRNGVERDINTPNKGRSWDWQHINEQINLLALANLVIINGNEVVLNSGEMELIEVFAEKYNEKPEFDVYSFDLTKASSRQMFFSVWEYYFSQLSDAYGMFDTSIEALGIPKDPLEPNVEANNTLSTLDIGDEGERYVYEYEKQRVSDFNARLAGKVIHFGKTRGLGYDIQSVVAQPGEDVEFVKYIEVKSTKRVTAPDISDTSWIDTLNVTRNEWIAAQQHGASYQIFRVYFTRDSVIIFIISDIASKHESDIITAIPTTYRVDFKNNAIDSIITNGGEVTDV